MNIRRILPSLLGAGLLAAGLAMTSGAQASVVIAATRVIYNAADKEVTLKLSNAGAQPALTQVWLDKGDPQAPPSSVEVPFVVTPPVSRIDPGKGQTLRILYSGEALPQDKESVFYLNVLEIPPKPAAGEEGSPNRLQLAFRSRIKFFFRPAGLQGTAQQAPAQVTWHLLGTNPTVLEAHNPTPYHVSFTTLAVGSARFDEGGMVAPGATARFTLKGAVGQAPGRKVHYQALNDYGGPVEGDAPLP